MGFIRVLLILNMLMSSMLMKSDDTSFMRVEMKLLCAVFILWMY